MAKYLIVHDYKSGLFGPYKAGDVVEIGDVDIEWLLRDSPGVAEPVQDKPKHKRKARGGKNRMVVQAKNRSEPEHVMTTENMVGLTRD